MIDKEAIIRRIEEWEANKANYSNFYEFEKAFDEMLQELGNEIFQQSFGEIPDNKNKKNDNY